MSKATEPVSTAADYDDKIGQVVSISLLRPNADIAEVRAGRLAGVSDTWSDDKIRSSAFYFEYTPSVTIYWDLDQSADITYENEANA